MGYENALNPEIFDTFASGSISEVIVIGAGLGGIGVAIDLQKNGFRDFLILERHHDVGGTWRDHCYPGLTVDVPTSLYSFSFEQRHSWSTFYAPRSELYDYSREVARKYGVYPHVRFGITVNKAVYDERENIWRIHAADGRIFLSRYIVIAAGFINLSKLPDIPGIADFAGEALHTTDWNEDTSLDGKRVGFIGTGASAIQIIPEIADRVERLDIYQRTPIWLLPKDDAPIGKNMKMLMRKVPGFKWLVRRKHSLLMDLFLIGGIVNYKLFGSFYRKMEGVAVKFIQSQVNDPEIQKKLTPKYSLGCKRISMSNTYYSTFNKKNVELITDGIRNITTSSIVSEDGKVRDVDAIVFATGYHVYSKDSTPTFPVFGLNGINLREFWDENRFQAYRGTTVAGYPNMFMINGPYSVCHASYIALIEDGSRHILRCLKKARREKANYIEVRAEAMEKDFQFCLAGKGKTIFGAGNCGTSNTYYYDAHGDSPQFRPTNRLSVWLASHFSRLSDYTIAKSGAPNIYRPGAIGKAESPTLI